MKKVSLLTITIFVTMLLIGCNSESDKKIVTGDGGIYKSNDGGKIFHSNNKISEEENLSGASILDLAINPNNSDIIYAGTTKYGIYRSSNGGQTWAESKSQFSYVRKIVLDPKNENIIYIVADLNEERAVFKTTDGGINWKKILSQRDREKPIALEIVIDHSNSNILYTTDSTGGVYKSIDGGKEWKAIYWTDSPVNILVMDSQNNQQLYLGTVDNRIYMSEDGGASFEESGSEEDIYNRYDIYSIATSKTEKGVVYVLSIVGLQVSRDSGKTYEKVNTLLPPDNTIAHQIVTDPIDKNVIYLIAGKIVYKTINAGETWTSIPLKISWPVKTFVIDKNNPDNIYMGVAKPPKQKNILFPF